MTARQQAQARLLVMAELTLAGLTVSAALGFRRLFVDGSFIPQVVFAAVAAHTTAALCRRRRLPAPVTAAIGFAAAILLTTWLQLGETTAFGLPTTETWRVAGDELRAALEAFGEVVAPAPVLPGFVLAASLGAWAIAFAADTAAFRARALLEAMVPAATLFVFGGALGTGAHRLTVSALFLSCAVGHWLAQRSLRAASAPTWLSSERDGGTRSLLQAGVAIGAIGVLAAVTIGPNLPGADARAMIPWRSSDRDQPESRVTISPLVDIRTRLVDQADLEVFRVSATQRSYWRLTSLEQFDGRRWTSDRRYRKADGQLGSAVDTSRGASQVSEQQFTIGALASIWLPAAFRPLEIDGADARYDPDSNSLLTEADTAAGQTYTVRSALPDLDPGQLRRVPNLAPRDVALTYTRLPDGFSPQVEAQAGRIVRGAPTQYDKALALQDFFRSGDFDYDLGVGPGHSGNDLEQFLFVTRRGYCEQFAGAYAAMARAVGLPARVAVGFTPGELDPSTGEYVVRGYNAHAWPEVYLDGYGWVPFEPTPGRGAPGAEGWTNVAEAQADAGDPTVATTTTLAPTAALPEGAAPTTVPPAPLQDDSLLPGQDDGSPWPRRLLAALLVVVVVPLVWVLALTVARGVRRRRRRAAATTPAERVLVAWDEVAEALARAGAAPEPWETPDEYARRAAAATGLDGVVLGGLAGLTTTATFGRGDLAEEVAQKAAGAAAGLEEAADALVPTRQRLRLLVDPRPLLPVRLARVDVRETAGC